MFSFITGRNRKIYFTKAKEIT